MPPARAPARDQFNKDEIALLEKLRFSARAELLTYKDLAIGKAAVANAVEEGPDAVITLILRQSGWHTKPEELADRKSLAVDLGVAYTSSLPLILKHHIEGDFVKQYKTSQEFNNLVQIMHRRGIRNKHPLTYRFTVARGADGSGHTVAELKAVLDLMEKYIDDDVAAIAMIDRQPVGTTLAGRYLTNNEGDYKVIRALVIRHFIENTRLRIAALSSDDILHPFYMVGTTIDPARRQIGHTTFSSSNYVLAVIYAASQYLQPDQNWQPYWLPMFMCFTPRSTAASEILFDGLGCAAVAYGAGCTYCRPGTPVNGINDIPNQVWAGHMQWVFATFDTQSLWQAAAEKDPLLMRYKKEIERDKKAKHSNSPAAIRHRALVAEFNGRRRMLEDSRASSESPVLSSVADQPDGGSYDPALGTQLDASSDTEVMAEGTQNGSQVGFSSSSAEYDLDDQEDVARELQELAL